MKQKTLVISISIVVIIGLLAIILLVNNSDGIDVNEKDSLEIGFIGPFSGDVATYGIPLKQIVEFAKEEINAAGGIDGKSLNILYEDGLCDAKEATFAAQKMINIDKVKVILTFCSGETLGTAPIAEPNKVIVFSMGSGSPDVTNAGDYIFRNFPSDASSASKIAKSAYETGNTKIAIINEQRDYASALVNAFTSSFTELGGEIVAHEKFNPDSKDFKAQVLKIKSSNPDGVYLISQTYSSYTLVLKQLKEMGIDAQLYTNEFASTPDVLDNFPNEIEGAIFAEPAFDENSPKAKELFEKLSRRYDDVSGALPPVYWATDYDAVYILKEAIESCDGTSDTDCIRDYLYGIRDRDGAAGMLTIDKNGDAVFEYELKRIDNGKVVVV